MFFMFNIFINYSNTGITGLFQMSSAKEMRFMQIYPVNERERERERAQWLNYFEIIVTKIISKSVKI